MANIKLPELGEGISSVEISDILVSEGDNVIKDDPIIVVESDSVLGISDEFPNMLK